VIRSPDELACAPCFSGSRAGLITGFTCGTFNLELVTLDVADCIHNTHHLACTLHALHLCPCAPCGHLACLFPTAHATSLCPRRHITAPRHCTHHLAVPLSLDVLRHHAPSHRTCHLAVPLSPHALCCHVPCNLTRHLTVHIAATHAAHLAATMATTTATTPKQREYCDHPHHNYHIVSTTSTTSATHDHHDKLQPPQPWRAHSGSRWRPSLTCHVQCLKKLVKCFEHFDCSGHILRTKEGKNM